MISDLYDLKSLQLEIKVVDMDLRTPESLCHHLTFYLQLEYYLEDTTQL